ncbi:MAG: purine/pyrimidine permease [Chloroflexi bacterium]|nr:purine/pyrimidine permease [Chloroflexota bacterium]MBV9898912.1 purine/pyrimidine permease [Chloroflexota bacterium]
MSPSAAALVYGRNERPRSTQDWCLYSFQWLVTMVYAVVWGYAIVGVGLNFQGGQMTTYISSVVLTIGLSTLLQAWLGHRMAMVHGPNVIPSLAIVAAFAAGGEAYALQSFAAQAIAGVIIIGLVFVGAVRYIRQVWSPLILGSMIIMIGLTVAQVGLGDMTQAGFGLGFLIALVLALGGTILAIRGRGVLATLPPVFVIVLGYIIFLALGRVDLTLVRQAPLLSIPALFPYGLTLPSWDLVLIMLIVNLMAAMNFYGNLHGYAEVTKEHVSDSEEQRAFVLFGLVETVLPGILGTPATVAYGENLGIVQLTRVAARSFVIVAAAIFVNLAFIGPFGALMAVMPKEVAGAVLLGIASSVIGIGASILNSAPAFDRREQTLVGFSIFLSLGLHLLPHETWQQTPRLIETVFSNP